MALSGFKSYEETGTKIKTLCLIHHSVVIDLFSRELLQFFYFVIDHKEENRKEKRSKNIFRVGRNVKRYEGWKLEFSSWTRTLIDLSRGIFVTFPGGIIDYFPVEATMHQLFRFSTFELAAKFPGSRATRFPSRQLHSNQLPNPIPAIKYNFIRDLIAWFRRHISCSFRVFPCCVTRGRFRRSTESSLEW